MAIRTQKCSGLHDKVYLYPQKYVESWPFGLDLGGFGRLSDLLWGLRYRFAREGCVGSRKAALQFKFRRDSRHHHLRSRNLGVRGLRVPGFLGFGAVVLSKCGCCFQLSWVRIVVCSCGKDRGSSLVVLGGRGVLHSGLIGVLVSSSYPYSKV